MSSFVMPEHTFLLEEYAYLLEFSLATYETLCCRAKQPKGELDRHEGIIRHGLHTLGTDLKNPTLAQARRSPRVLEIAQMIEKEGYDAGVQRYFNQHRYRIG
jgi:hypothetical protein